MSTAARWRRASGGLWRCRPDGTSRWALAVWSITPGIGQRPLRRRKRAVPVPRFERRGRGPLRRRAVVRRSGVAGLYVGVAAQGRVGLGRAAHRRRCDADCRWAAVDGVRPHGGKDAEKHALRVEADTATVTFLVDGIKVAAMPRADVAPTGISASASAAAVNIHVVRLDFTAATGAAPRLPSPEAAPASTSSQRWSPGSGLGGTAVVPQVAGTANVLGDQPEPIP